MNRKRLTTLLVGYALFATLAAAADFSTHYVSAARQIWFFTPLEKKNVYRLCVVMFNQEGEPHRAVVASEATHVDGGWTIREGRELIFAPASFETRSAKKIAGPLPELSLDPKSDARVDPRIQRISRGWLFAERDSHPPYANASVFAVDERTQVVSYIFARQAVIGEKKTPSINLSGILLVRSWPDARVPEMVTMDAIAFP
jgi:hypothetical protein